MSPGTSLYSHTEFDDHEFFFMPLYPSTVAGRVRHHKEGQPRVETRGLAGVM